MTAEPHGEVVTPVPELSGGFHFPCLDAYRGIGMTMVLLNHAAYATGYMSRHDGGADLLGPLIARLDLSVPMFFVMSGFLLYRPFAKATLQSRAPLPLRTFYRRRALRIFPAYWVALVALGVLGLLQIASVNQWIGNALLLPAFGAPVHVCNEVGSCHVAYAITQAWSIGVELAFYLLLPLYSMLIAKLAAGRDGRRDLRERTIVLLAGLAGLYLVGTAFRVFVVTAEPAWAEQSLLWLPMFLDLFAIGMALAVVSAAFQLGQVLPRVFAWLGEHPNVCWLIAGAIFLAVTRMRYPDRPFGLHDSTGYSDYIPRQLLYGIASAVWLAPAIFGDQTKGVIRRMLAAKPLVFLGSVSLSFYLWHLVVIDKVKERTVPDYDTLRERALHPRPGNTLDGVGTFQGNYLKIVVIAWAISFGVATVLFYLVELPYLRLKDGPLRSLLPARKPRQ